MATMLNLTKKLREAVKANQNIRKNLYTCILLHEAANEIERLNRKLAKTDPQPLSLVEPFSDLEVRP